jgi:hypothetical protein
MRKARAIVGSAWNHFFAKCRMTNTINPTQTITSLNSTIVTPPAKPKPAMIITAAISNAINSVVSNIIFTPPFFFLLFH